MVVNETWTGAQDVNNNSLWYGFNIGTGLTGANAPANTACSNDTCVGNPDILYVQWIQVFVEKNPNFNVGNITHLQFDKIFNESAQQWNFVFGTDNPDLSQFREAGGKILSYHGLVSSKTFLCIFPLGQAYRES